MGRFPITWVVCWSVVSLGLSLVYGVCGIVFNKPSVPLSAQLVYLWIGMLGVLVANVLKAQQRRISQLENALSQQR